MCVCVDSVSSEYVDCVVSVVSSVCDSVETVNWQRSVTVDMLLAVGFDRRCVMADTVSDTDQQP